MTQHGNIEYLKIYINSKLLTDGNFSLRVSNTVSGSYHQQDLENVHFFLVFARF